MKWALMLCSQEQRVPVQNFEYGAVFVVVVVDVWMNCSQKESRCIKQVEQNPDPRATLFSNSESGAAIHASVAAREKQHKIGLLCCNVVARRLSNVLTTPAVSAAYYRLLCQHLHCL